MAIRLGSAAVALESRLQLPDGLRWDDEFAWSATAQSTDYTLTGALVVEQGTRLAGRPLTLVGGRHYAWMQRGDIKTLSGICDTPPDDLRLTLHDAREYQVIPDGAGRALETYPLPRVAVGGQESGLADPADTEQYVIERIRFLIIAEIV